MICANGDANPMSRNTVVHWHHYLSDTLSVFIGEDDQMWKIIVCNDKVLCQFSSILYQLIIFMNFLDSHITITIIGRPITNDSVKYDNDIINKLKQKKVN
jgi:hypothetical protein